MRMKRPLLNIIEINRGDNDSGELFFFSNSMVIMAAKFRCKAILFT